MLGTIIDNAQRHIRNEQLMNHLLNKPSLTTIGKTLFQQIKQVADQKNQTDIYSSL